MCIGMLTLPEVHNVPRTEREKRARESVDSEMLAEMADDFTQEREGRMPGDRSDIDKEPPIPSTTCDYDTADGTAAMGSLQNDMDSTVEESKPLPVFQLSGFDNKVLVLMVELQSVY